MSLTDVVASPSCPTAVDTSAMESLLEDWHHKNKKETRKICWHDNKYGEQSVVRCYLNVCVIPTSCDKNVL
jgi:hypothetical protein